jgi:hypothetical protein
LARDAIVETFLIAPVIVVLVQMSWGSVMSGIHELLAQGLVLGLDSFVAGLLIGAVLRNEHQRLALASSFAVADGLSSLAGVAVPTLISPPS